MTTIIGLRGKEPNTLEHYVIMASDTRGTSARSGPLGEVRKIFGNPSSNLVIAGAGRSLVDCFPGKSYLQEFMDSPVFRSEGQLTNMFSEMNDYMASIGERNEYLAAIKGDKPGLYSFAHGKLMNILSYKIIGSGRDYVWSFDRLPWQEQDGRLLMSKEDAITEIEKAYNIVASKDCYTGEHIDLAIITPSTMEFMRNFSKIETSQKNQIPVLWKDVREVVNPHPLYTMGD